jgi:hypothetical protein
MLSGGDQVSLLRHFFFSLGGHPSLLDQLGFEPKDTSQQLVAALQPLHASAFSHKDKHVVLSAISPVFSPKEPWQQGFRFCSA